MWLSKTDRPDMTLDVYRGRKTTMQQQQQQPFLEHCTDYVLRIPNYMVLMLDRYCDIMFAKIMLILVRN